MILKQLQFIETETRLQAPVSHGGFESFPRNTTLTREQ